MSLFHLTDGNPTSLQVADAGSDISEMAMLHLEKINKAVRGILLIARLEDHKDLTGLAELADSLISDADDQIDVHREEFVLLSKALKVRSKK